jgi:hypothetical protein
MTYARCFNEHRDPSLPEISEATGAILETIWEDDYESFGLVNPLDDPEGFRLVKKLDELVRKSGCRTPTDEEVARWKEDGWHSAEATDSDADVVAALCKAEAFAPLDELFHLFVDPN